MVAVTRAAQIKRDIETYRAVLDDERRHLGAVYERAPGSTACYNVMDRVERAGWIVAALQAYLAELERKS